VEIFKKRNITKWIVFLPSFAIFLTSASILIIFVLAQRAEYARSVEESRTKYIQASKETSKERIEKIIDYINVNEKFLINEGREEIKNIVNFAHKIIIDIYKENSKLPREKILEKIGAKLRDMRFFDNLSGYYFVYDLNGVNIVLGPNRALEGENLIYITDADGNSPVQKALDLVKTQEGSFYDWNWQNPGEAMPRKKVGYVKRFEPLNIFFGSARYEDEIIEKIKKETQQLLLNTRFGESDYIFAFDHQGNTISHGGRELVGSNRWDVMTDGRYLIRDIVEGAKKHPDGFFHSYTAGFNPNNDQDSQKISFIKAIPQFGWVIGSGVYVAQQKKELEEQQRVLQEKMQETIVNMFLVSLVIMILLIVAMFAISQKLKLMLTQYESHLLLTNKQVKEQKKVFETLYQKSADGIWLLKGDTFVDCNEAVIKMFGAKDRSELIGIGPIDIAPEFQPDGQNSYEKSLEMHALATQNGVHKFEWYAKAVDGRLFWISVVMTAIYIKDGLIQHCAIRDITLRKSLEEENKKQKKLLMHQVEHDILTGLPNRNLLQDRLTQAIKKASRDGNMLAVIFIDVDKFKNINDTLGHDMGDMLLRYIASRMKSHTRETDTVARMSGDEFIILLDGCKDVSDIFIAIKKLTSAFIQPFPLGNESFKVTLSVGVSVYPRDGVSATKLLKNADIAMYKAKMEGRNRCKFFDQEMNAETNEHLEIEKSLDKALRDNEFVLFYQPQINLQTEQIVGFEALIRWNHPLRGLVMPNAFIHVAEESELIVEIGNWVAKEAMRQMKEWYDMGLNPGKVAINFAGKQLDSLGLVPFVAQSLEESGCLSSWIEIEIVERFIMKDTTKSIKLLTGLRNLGVDISIDDFGTGHSSLAYLKHLPVTKLKIDQSFVQNLENSPQDRAIARTIIELGRGLGLRVLAEGVENQAQKEFIYQSGCELMQGYFFSKPVSAEDAKELLKNQIQML
jgi:diguanylate cyclase (GGDEF)-like protein/PAS domain S-box-containing protein